MFRGRRRRATELRSGSGLRRGAAKFRAAGESAPSCRGEFEDTRLEPGGNEAEKIAEVGLRPDVVQLAAGDERRYRGVHGGAVAEPRCGTFKDAWMKQDATCSLRLNTKTMHGSCCYTGQGGMDSGAGLRRPVQVWQRTRRDPSRFWWGVCRGRKRIETSWQRDEIMSFRVGRFGVLGPRSRWSMCAMT